MATIRLPVNLVSLFPGATTRLELAAGDVDELLDQLDRRWPGMRFRLCPDRESLRPHINVFVDGEKSTVATPLRPGSDVRIMTAVSGG